MCGAPTRPNAPSCEYCKAPLASVHCSACFTLNSASAAHCAGCGAKLGLEPLDVATEHRCPECRAECRGFAAGSGRLFECTRCGGQFVEHGLLEDLLERRELHRVVVRALPARLNPLARPVHYLKCPVCTTVMNRNNFGKTSGVVVDVCPRHGVWFDPGELPRILAFVQAGGLEQARQRAAQERATRERDAKLAAESLRGGRLETDTSDDLVRIVGDALGELLDHVRSVFRGSR